MTPRQRMLTAMCNRIPDRVPVAPDISNMIPARLTGRPFWDIYLDGDPPLWRAYIDAVRLYGMDGWFIYGRPDYEWEPTQAEAASEIVERTDERIVRRTTWRTPGGSLSSCVAYYPDIPPRHVEPLIKDPERDVELYLKYVTRTAKGASGRTLAEQREALGEDGALGVGVGLPGLHAWVEMFEGGMETLTYLYYDHPELLERLARRDHEMRLATLEHALPLAPDFILAGASGALTLQSPSIFRQLSLPTLKEITRRCRAAGVPCQLHCCGLEAELARICAEETELTSINPLEPPPMGDCNLGEIKRRYGGRLSLMGNLHTTDVMLLGGPDDVAEAAKRAIDDAAPGGGFILSTGDQCGRDTPDANLLALVDTARRYGCYG